MPGPWETKKILITVRTYPNPSKKSVEVSCTAGITKDGQWIRLFPIPYRFLDKDHRFHKYQWIEARVRKASDSRPESFNIDCDSIQIVSHVSPDDFWRDRRKLLEPVQKHCHCCIEKERRANGSPTLGFFRPRSIKGLIIEPDEADWSAEQLAYLTHPDMFPRAVVSQLEKVPFRFKYSFQCDHDECRGHNLSCTDWEMGASWRYWRDDYGAEWEAKFRQRYEAEMSHKLDTHFFVGTLRSRAYTWNIVGLFYPLLPKPDPQRRLFD